MQDEEQVRGSSLSVSFLLTREMQYSSLRRRSRAFPKDYSNSLKQALNSRYHQGLDVQTGSSVSNTLASLAAVTTDGNNRLEQLGSGIYLSNSARCLLIYRQTSQPINQLGEKCSWFNEGKFKHHLMRAIRSNDFSPRSYK